MGGWVDGRQEQADREVKLGTEEGLCESRSRTAASRLFLVDVNLTRWLGSAKQSCGQTPGPWLSAIRIRACLVCALGALALS